MAAPDKTPLRSLLQDEAMMNDLRGDGEMLEAARAAGGGESLEVVLNDGDAGLQPGNYTRTEAIILLKGRPALLIRDGEWEPPESAEIRRRLQPAAEALKETIPKVGRVEILNSSSDHIGTGWMVEENVLITNRHVAVLFAEKRGAGFLPRADAAGKLLRTQVDFRREHGRTAIHPAAVEEVLFIEQPGDLWPDLALVRLDPSAGSLPEPVELDPTPPVRGANVGVIGYPARDLRNDSFAMDDLFRGVYNVKRLSPGLLIGVRGDGKHLEHDCTTLGGSSGSLVFNLDTRKACGLHFAGDYLERNFAVSALWIKARLAELGRIQVRVTAAPAFHDAPSPGPTPAEDGDAVRADLVEGRALPPPDLSTGRRGYRREFLGQEVELPEIDESLQAQIAPVTGRRDGLLHYTHFSVCMRADRRLPFFTAVNIDGGRLYNFPRGADRWFDDARLADVRAQVGAGFYRGSGLNRGHLVRRLDPAWGRTRAEAKQAEEDTFFFTNCSPQHPRLNQRTWLSLEDYVLGNACTHELKVTVFSGPVMAAADRDYRGTLLPEEFWKVVVLVNTFTRQLSATGYLLSQSDYLSSLEFVYGEFKTYQVPLRRIEAKTGLVFHLREHDPLARTEARPERLVLGRDDLLL